MAEQLHYERPPGYDRIKAVNVPPLPPDIIEGLKPYEVATNSYNIAGTDKVETSRLFYKHRPSGESLSQIFSVTRPKDAEPQRLTYFDVGGGRTIATWTGISSDNLRGKPRQGGAIFSMDLNGNEVYKLWRYWEDKSEELLEKTALELDNKPGRGRIELLTDDDFKNHTPVVSAHGRGNLVAFSSTRGNGKDTKVYTVDLSKEGWKPVMVFDNTRGFCEASSFSSDDSRLMVCRRSSHNDISRWIVNLSDPAAAPVELVLPGITTGGPIAIRSAAFSPLKGSTEVILALDAYSDFLSVVVYDFTTGAVRHITTPEPSLSPILAIPWDVQLAAVTAEYAVLLANADGWCDVYRYEFSTSRIQKITIAGHEKDILANVQPMLTTPSDNRVVFEHSSSHVAASISMLDLSEVSSGSVNLHPFLACQSGTPDFPTQDPIIIRYKSFDGLSIPALLYYPPNSPPSGKVPAMIWIHGGPAMQIRPGFRSLTNGYILNELGCALIMPNVRGSAGYGKTYTTLDDVYKREDSVKDIGSLLEYIRESLPKIDSSRIALNGISYGGYMVLASLVHYSPLVRCGIVQSGIGNWISFLESTHPSRVAYARVEYGDETDPEVRKFLENISPLTHADRINVPLLLVHGETDSRVPVGQAIAMFQAVAAKGLDSWLVVAEQEGHGFRYKSSVQYISASKAAFLRKWLLDN